MKIVTGLVPTAERWALPDEYTKMTLGGVPLVLPTPANAARVGERGRVCWVLQFATPSDTVEARRGSILSVMLLGTEPVIQEHHVMLTQLDDFPEHEAAYEAHIRRGRGIPEDALVTDYPALAYNGRNRELRWWEVTA